MGSDDLAISLIGEEISRSDDQVVEMGQRLIHIIEGVERRIKKGRSPNVLGELGLYASQYDAQCGRNAALRFMREELQRRRDG
jgi:hypothetical protein